MVRMKKNNTLTSEGQLPKQLVPTEREPPSQEDPEPVLPYALPWPPSGGREWTTCNEHCWGWPSEVPAQTPHRGLSRPRAHAPSRIPEATWCR